MPSVQTGAPQTRLAQAVVVVVVVVVGQKFPPRLPLKQAVVTCPRAQTVQAEGAGVLTLVVLVPVEVLVLAVLLTMPVLLTVLLTVPAPVLLPVLLPVPPATRELPVVPVVPGRRSQRRPLRRWWRRHCTSARRSCSRTSTCRRLMLSGIGRACT